MLYFKKINEGSIWLPSIILLPAFIIKNIFFLIGVNFLNFIPAIYLSKVSTLFFVFVLLGVSLVLIIYLFNKPFNHFLLSLLSTFLVYFIGNYIEFKLISYKIALSVRNFANSEEYNQIVKGFDKLRQNKQKSLSKTSEGLPVTFNSRIVDSKRLIFIETIDPQSSLGKQNLAVGDIIVQVDNFKIDTINAAYSILSDNRFGGSLQLTIQREGKPYLVSLPPGTMTVGSSTIDRQVFHKYEKFKLIRCEEYEGLSPDLKTQKTNDRGCDSPGALCDFIDLKSCSDFSGKMACNRNVVTYVREPLRVVSYSDNDISSTFDFAPSQCLSLASDERLKKTDPDYRETIDQECKFDDVILIKKLSDRENRRLLFTYTNCLATYNINFSRPNLDLIAGSWVLDKSSINEINPVTNKRFEIFKKGYKYYLNGYGDEPLNLTHNNVYISAANSKTKILILVTEGSRLIIPNNKKTLFLRR